jgi:hypothetical protein
LGAIFFLLRVGFGVLPFILFLTNLRLSRKGVVVAGWMWVAAAGGVAGIA